MKQNLTKVTIRVNPDDIRTLQKFCPDIPYNEVIRKILHTTCQRLIAADNAQAQSVPIPTLTLEELNEL